MDEVVELVAAALAMVGRSAPVRTLSYRALFEQYAGVDPHLCPLDALRRQLTEFNIHPAGLQRNDWLDLVLTHRIEPQLAAAEMITLVHDYPASQAALARIRPGDPPLAERFECYVGGAELANGYHELADASEQRARFEADLARRRARGGTVPPIDERLLAALAQGSPACSGVALGVDRLLMVLQRTSAIEDVLVLPFNRA